ncbi:class I SAM-dependent methyltransferase [Hyphomicrobium sp. DY-1]|uniref:class I SAM-dependent methyltransferase n=1 Tax=Hyphomicrobium sp. DY-1 TaxID=3075650 RepID=UPI0039C0AC45
MKTFSGRRASQREDELKGFVDMLKDWCTMSYLEIGARHGDTFHHVMSALPKGSVGVAVDLPGGAWGTDKSAEHLVRAAEDLTRNGYHVDVIFGDSTSKRVLDEIRTYRKFDAILIDGDHRYDGVKADWDAYQNLGRLVAFHDIDGDGQTTKDGRFLHVEVPKLWGEIKLEYDVIEFISPLRGMGLGIVMMDDKPW